MGSNWWSWEQGDVRNGSGSHYDSEAYVISEKAVSDQIWMGTKEQNIWPIRSLRILPAGQTLILSYSRTLEGVSVEGAVCVSSRN